MHFNNRSNKGRVGNVTHSGVNNEKHTLNLSAPQPQNGPNYHTRN